MGQSQGFSVSPGETSSPSESQNLHESLPAHHAVQLSPTAHSLLSGNSIWLPVSVQIFISSSSVNTVTLFGGLTHSHSCRPSTPHLHTLPAAPFLPSRPCSISPPLSALPVLLVPLPVSLPLLAIQPASHIKQRGVIQSITSRVLFFIDLLLSSCAPSS